MVQQTADSTSFAPEQIEHAVRVIGKSQLRRAVFSAVYHGKKKQKTVRELIKATNLDHKQVLMAGKSLADQNLVLIGRNDETYYEKIPFFSANKRKILSYLDDPQKLKNHDTVRNSNGRTKLQIVVSSKSAEATRIHIDDIANFHDVASIEHSQKMLADELSENQFKRGVQNLCNEAGDFNDWGGERLDFYTTHLKIRSRRVAAAFSFKGPALKGQLVPAKAGKNGDQTLRLFSVDADLYVFQHCRKIAESFVDLMHLLALAKASMVGRKIHYCLIDGSDSLRLVKAYPAAFGIGKI